MILTIPSVLFYILIAALCGAIGRAIAGDGRGGFLLSFVVGFVGAIIGPLIADYFKLSEPWTITVLGQNFGILWAIIGSVAFTSIVLLFSRRR